MGIQVRHVVWTSAALSMGAFIYVVTLEPMDERQHPRAVAIEQAPYFSDLQSNVISSLASGQNERAITQARELVSAYPTDIRSSFYLALTHRQMGNKDESRRVWTQIINYLEWTDDSIGTSENIYYYAWAIRETGEFEASQAIFGQIADQYALLTKDGDDEWGGYGAGDHYNLACYRALAGDLDLAMEHWSFAVELGFGGGASNQWWTVDPDLEPLHEFDRFWELGSQIGQAEREHDAP
jgi:tetratricopeptide (TPR) repeat protein